MIIDLFIHLIETMRARLFCVLPPEEVVITLRRATPLF